MEKTVNKLLSDKFLKLIEEGGNIENRRFGEGICLAQEELISSLSEKQLKLFQELEGLIIDNETDKMERMFRIGFLEGLNVGRAIFS